MKLKKIDHINIVVSDIEKAKDFFVTIGLVPNPDREGNIGGPWIDKVTKLKDASGYYCTLTIPGAQTNLELIHYDSPKSKTAFPKSKPNQLGLRHLAFEVENIEEIVSKLKKKGVSFFSEIQDYKESNKKLCYFYGPDGIILELAEYK
jgi:catechol 2,3-dioxygenase-like lactoylglutathione lyase family enzyme